MKPGDNVLKIKHWNVFIYLYISQSVLNYLFKLNYKHIFFKTKIREAIGLKCASNTACFSLMHIIVFLSQWYFLMLMLVMCVLHWPIMTSRFPVIHADMLTQWLQHFLLGVWKKPRYEFSCQTTQTIHSYWLFFSEWLREREREMLAVASESWQIK